MMKTPAVALFLVLCLWIIGTSANAAIIDFDGTAVANGDLLSDVLPYLEDGFEIVDGSGRTGTLMAHEIANLILKHASRFLTPDEAFHAATSTGMPQNEAADRVAEAFAAFTEKRPKNLSTPVVHRVEPMAQCGWGHGIVAVANG